MGATLRVIEGGDKSAKVIEVATTQLSEHSKQAEYSPPMSKKKWAEFVANIKSNGIRQPLVVTEGFRVIDGRHRLRAAKELGIESVRVIIEDIDEGSIPSYITDTKLQRDDLKSGQKAAIVIRLHYEEERMKAEKRKQATQFGKDTDVPMLEQPQDGRTNEILAKKAGIGKSSMAYLLAVYRSRSDLFERVFSGEYSINRAYTTMKADEIPEDAENITPIEEAKADIKELIENDSTQPQFKDDEHELSPHNMVVRMRKKALSTTAEILDSVENIEKTDDDVKESAKDQLLSLAKSCLIVLGQTSESQKDIELIHFGLELLDQLNK